MVNRSQHNSWKKKQSKSHSNPSQNSWKQRKSAAPVEPVPKHRSIRCMAEGPTPCRSIFSGWRQKSSKAPVEPMVKKSKHRCNESPLFQRACFDGLQPLFSTGWTDAPKSKHRCNESPLFQRACFGGLQLSSAPVEPTVQNQSTGALEVLCSRTLVWVDQRTSSAPVEPMPLRSMHRCNDASMDTVSELQRLLLWHRETGWTDAHIFYTVGSSGGHGFSAENFQRLCDLLHSI